MEVLMYIRLIGGLVGQILKKIEFKHLMIGLVIAFFVFFFWAFPYWLSSSSYRYYYKVVDLYSGKCYIISDYKASMIDGITFQCNGVTVALDYSEYKMWKSTNLDELCPSAPVRMVIKGETKDIECVMCDGVIRE